MICPRSPIRCGVRCAALCVMNNAGGGLFELTAARRIDRYEMTMRNAPAVAFDGVARAFGLVHRPCGDMAALDAALAEAAKADALFTH